MEFKELLNNIEQLQNRLEFYLNKKKINYAKTELHTSSIKEVSNSINNVKTDIFCDYMIQDKECDKKIMQYRTELLNYETLLNKEIERMSRYDEIGLIVFLRFSCNWKWKDIDKALNRGTDYCRTLYNRFKKNENDTI